MKSEHTPFEWELQIAADHVDPIGEDRADIRAAINTANLIASNSTEMNADKFAELVDGLRNYLQTTQPQTENVSEVLALMKTGD